MIKAFNYKQPISVFIMRGLLGKSQETKQHLIYK